LARVVFATVLFTGLGAELHSAALAQSPYPSSGRYSGTLVTVDSATRTLVVDELTVAARPRRLTFRVDPDARIVLSQRVGDREVQDFGRTFREDQIGFGDLRPGDFVVVESSPDGKTYRASLVTVTLRAGASAAEGSGQTAVRR
jgi:hypothetical protein